MKTDIEVLKSVTTQCLEATKSASEASTLVAEQISKLLLEMKENDVREEYRKEELVALKGAITVVNKKIEELMPVISRSKIYHGRIDKLFEGMSTNAGKIVIIAFILGVLYMLGIDPTSYIK